jgi:hypothetical protein
LPMIAHFVNNAFPVILVYIQGLDKLNTPSDVPLWHQAISLPLPMVIVFVIFYYFRSKKTDSDVMNINLRPES